MQEHNKASEDMVLYNKEVALNVVDKLKAYGVKYVPVSSLIDMKTSPIKFIRRKFI